MSKSKRRNRHKKPQTPPSTDTAGTTSSSGACAKFSSLKHSAARRVHDLEHLRKEIARYLTKPDLAKYCVRISRLWLETAAEILYRDVNAPVFGGLVGTGKKSPSIRATEIYAPFVRTISTNLEAEAFCEYAIPIGLTHPHVREVRGWRCRVDLAKRTVYIMRNLQIEGPERNHYSMDPTEEESGCNSWPNGFTRIFEESLQINEITGEDLVPKRYIRRRGLRNPRCTDQFRISDVYIVRDISLPRSWLKTIGDLEWLESLTVESSHSPPVEEMLQLLEMRPKGLKRFAIVLGDGADQLDQSVSPMSDLPSILLAGEGVWEHLELAIRMEYTPPSVAALLSSCLDLARERGQEHTICNPSDRGAGRQVLSMFVYIATAELSQDLLDTMPAIAHAHQLLLAAMSDLDLYFCFDDPWLDSIYLHYRWRMPHVSIESFSRAVESVTVDEWWYPGDVLGWVD